MINEIDPEIREMAGEVIAFAYKKISKKLNYHAFIAMADHMHGVVLREKDDIYLKNFLMWDIKRFFPEEFEVGKYANQLLSQYFGKDLPDDEAGFMALTIREWCSCKRFDHVDGRNHDHCQVQFRDFSG